MLKEEIELVKTIAREIAKEEIAKALPTLKAPAAFKPSEGEQVVMGAAVTGSGYQPEPLSEDKKKKGKPPEKP